MSIGTWLLGMTLWVHPGTGLPFASVIVTRSASYWARLIP